MKAAAALSLLVTMVLAQGRCPTITKEALPSTCAGNCGQADCMFLSTVRNPCGCPAQVATATLLHPCGAECPYNGCGVSYSIVETCATASTRPQPPPESPTTNQPTTINRPTTISRPTGSTSVPSVTTSITTIQRPSVTTSITSLQPVRAACPTVTRVTQPSDCEPMRCPIPNCTFQSRVSVPCGCNGPKTVLSVQLCPTACPDGCMTRTTTMSQSDCGDD